MERLLGDLPVSSFVEEHLHRLPLARTGGARPFVPLASWNILERALAREGADVLVARDGRPWEKGGTPTAEQARQLYASGYTLVLRNAERHDAALADLASSFFEDFQAPVNIHLYCTPADGQGFGWHYDAEDVFILQARGRKEYSLRKNTVHPWPLLETIPKDMGFERETHPLSLRCMLEEGDWLYIPAGYWHVARAVTESVSLAVGVMMPAATAVLDFLRREVPGSVIWRQRLPVGGRALPRSEAERIEAYRSLFAELGEDLARRMRDDLFVERFMAFRKSVSRPEP
ncbi:MAG: hypothetical protein HY716_12280 [Planctomycetes bacterium]|nr:hypothetical protein [Planctomycetota bacterium]